MSAKRENAALIGAGVAACAVCCAGPILGVLAAIGLGTAAGVALFGTVAVFLGVVAVSVVVMRRRRSTARSCAPAAAGSAPVELSDTRGRR